MSGGGVREGAQICGVDLSVTVEAPEKLIHKAGVQVERQAVGQFRRQALFAAVEHVEMVFKAQIGLAGKILWLDVIGHYPAFFLLGGQTPHDHIVAVRVEPFHGFRAAGHGVGFFEIRSGPFRFAVKMAGVQQGRVIRQRHGAQMLFEAKIHHWPGGNLDT